MATTRGWRGAWIAAAATLFASVLTPRNSRAQVNAEVLRPNPFRPGWSGGLEGSLALSRGNIELLDVGGAGRIQYQTLHPQPSADAGTSTPVLSAVPYIAQRVFLTASGRYAQRIETPFVSQAFVHARWIGMWHPIVGTDVFAQYQYNQFLRLQARAVAGVGVRVELVHHSLFAMWAGSGYLFEYNLLSLLPGSTDPPESFEHRWTNYLTLRLALFQNRLLLQNTTYFQPRFDAFTDFRFLEEFELLSRITDAFGSGITLSVLHDSAPPMGVQSTDLRLLTTIRLSL